MELETRVKLTQLRRSTTNPNSTIDETVELIELLRSKVSLRAAEKACQKAMTKALEDNNLLNHAILKSRLGAIYINMNRIDESSILLKEALRVLKRSKEHRYQLSTLGNLAICYGIQQDYHTAIIYHLKVSSIAAKLGESVTLSTSFNNIGDIYTQLGDYKHTDLYLRKAEKIALKNKLSNGLFSIYDSWATSMINRGFYLNAKPYIEKMEKIAISQDSQMFWIEYSEKMGIMFSRMNLYSKAIEFLEMAIQKRQDLGYLNLFSSDLSQLSWCQYQLKDYQSALQSINQSIEFDKNTGSYNRMPNSLYTKSRILVEENQLNEALYCADLSVKIALRQNTDMEDVIVLRLNAIEISSLLGNRRGIRRRIHSILDLIPNLKDQNLFLDIYHCLAKIYSNIKDNKQAVHWFNKYITQMLEDNLNEEVTMQQNSFLEYEKETLQRKIKIMKKTSEKLFHQIDRFKNENAYLKVNVSELTRYAAWGREIDNFIHRQKAMLNDMGYRLNELTSYLEKPEAKKSKEASGHIEELRTLITKQREQWDSLKNRQYNRLDREELDINDVILSILKEYDCYTLNVVIKHDLQKNLPRIYGYYVDFSIILWNLIDNAVKAVHFSSNQSHIWDVMIYTMSTDHNIFISIEDRGIGMDSDTLVQLENVLRGQDDIITNHNILKHTFPEGHGIGLVGISKYLNEMNIDVKIKSIMNEGTRFDLLVPMESKHE